MGLQRESISTLVYSGVVDDIEDDGNLASTRAEVDEYDSADLDEEIFFLVLSNHFLKLSLYK